METYKLFQQMIIKDALSANKKRIDEFETLIFRRTPVNKTKNPEINDVNLSEDLMLFGKGSELGCGDKEEDLPVILNDINCKSLNRIDTRNIPILLKMEENFRINLIRDVNKLLEQQDIGQERRNTYTRKYIIDELIPYLFNRCTEHANKILKDI